MRTKGQKWGNGLGLRIPKATGVTPRWASRLLRVAAAGAVAGTVLGVLGRLAMAALAVVGGGAPRFSLGGSFEVVAFGLLVGVPAAAVFALWLRFAPGRDLLKGLAFGLALFALLLLLPPPAARSAAAGAPAVVLRTAVALFAAVFAAYGLLLGWLTRRCGAS
jgi:hypothetical protein